MNDTHLIIASEFCMHHQVERSFLVELHRSGLVELVGEQENLSIPGDELQKIERLCRFHYEMDINLEGLETITHLLERMQDMQQQIRELQGRLGLYE